MEAARNKIRIIGGGGREKDEDRGDKENETPDDTARQIEIFLDGKLMTAVMTFLTIFALWGDNLRLWVFTKDADPVFYGVFVFSLFAFFIEFLLNTVAKPEYKWSFFFILDLIATVSLVPDIPWLTDIGVLIVEGSSDTAEGPSGAGGLSNARTARIVRLVRLIRLIRIVKLYSMVSKAKEADQEEKLKAQARAALNAKQAALKRVEASRLGKVLSEHTTRRVIVGVLFMLFITPYLRVTETDNSMYFGLAQLFWFGRSNCSSANTFGCDRQGVETVWLTEQGWKNYVWLYSQLSWHREYTTSSPEYWSDPARPPYRLLWLKAPNYLNGGKMEAIQSVHSEFGVWHETAECAGDTVPDGCPFRDSELSTVSFQPFECVHENGSCDQITAIARFEVRDFKARSAAWDMLSTLFVCVLLGTMSIQFQNDTQRLVIAPIEKMVNIIKQLAEDPLRKPEVMEFEGQVAVPKANTRKDKAGPQLETSMLENTILKIGSLLQVGFGAAGAEIIGNNMSSGDGELNIMMPGKSIHAIFGYCTLRDFGRTVYALQSEVTGYINTVGHIVHSCCHRWSGVANKSVGDGFLMLWKIADGAPEELGDLRSAEAISSVHPLVGGKKGQAQEANIIKASDLANRALFAFMKILAECQREPKILAFRNHDSIRAMLGEAEAEKFMVQLGFGLHVGWAIEGPIGSDFKIDASYLSPHIRRAVHLQEAAEKIYKVPILMSQKFYTILAVRSKERLRKIDMVTWGGNAASSLMNEKQGGQPGPGQLGMTSPSQANHAMAQPRGEGVYTFNVNISHDGMISNLPPLEMPEGAEELSEPPVVAPAGRKLGDLIKPGQLEELPDDTFDKDHTEYLFELDQDLAGMQIGLPETLNAEYRKGLCLYVDGNWGASKKTLSSLTAAPVADGPATAILEYLALHNYEVPEDWPGYRVLEME